MDVATFMQRFQTFKNTNAQLVAACIAEATLEVDPSVFRTMTDTAIGYLAADKLAKDPQGNNTRLVNQDDGTTTYGKAYEELRLSLVVGVIVSGGGRRGFW